MTTVDEVWANLRPAPQRPERSVDDRSVDEQLRDLFDQVHTNLVGDDRAEVLLGLATVATDKAVMCLADEATTAYVVLGEDSEPCEQLQDLLGGCRTVTATRRYRHEVEDGWWVMLDHRPRAARP